jgi:hypothetical protein
MSSLLPHCRLLQLLQLLLLPLLLLLRALASPKSPAAWGVAAHLPCPPDPVAAACPAAHGPLLPFHLPADLLQLLCPGPVHSYWCWLLHCTPGAAAAPGEGLSQLLLLLLPPWSLPAAASWPPSWPPWPLLLQLLPPPQPAGQLLQLLRGVLCLHR